MRDPSSVSMSQPIHPISEKLVSLGMVFTESVLSWTFTCYCLTSFQQFGEMVGIPIAKSLAKCKSTVCVGLRSGFKRSMIALDFSKGVLIGS